MRRIEGIDLEEITVTDLPLPINGERTVRDSKTPYLGIRLRSSGSRTWIMYTQTNGQSKRITLGDATSIPLEIARSMLGAASLSKPLDQGRSAPLRSAESVAEVVAAYLVSGSDGKRWKASTGRLMETVARLHILPTFGDTPIRDVKRTDVLQWHGELSQRSSSARMALSTLSGAMTYAEDHGLRQHGSNPCQGLRKRSKSHRGSHLPPRSMRSLWQALDHYQPAMPDICDAVRLLILTGARKNEILHLRWDFIEGPRAVLPDSKTGPRTIWLNAPARALIASRQSRLEGRFVFPGRDGTAPLGV
ncbi:site-specific recombinase, phage integrase [Novosphingobium sp. Rr 2-17]|uniref:tyrosine-type recombinase/integrase n=1 Tax=Novosphingobium sp. Rr 2-17 TaxID=555793 RepID=UPI000269AB24|nr:site-specific recombinase, phage integrase [Novosphingobium sp. Rr 2-17]EIZ79594.1 site-specific recombinase, phage integrase [Novosphingobium sp. Rr 2-17]